MAETDNLKLALPGSNEYVDVEVLNENFRKIDTSVLLALAAAAPYSAAATYAVGAYCTKGGKLYRCTVVIPQAEAWNAAHWAETTMGAELVAIYTTLANKAPGGFGWGEAMKDVLASDAEDTYETYCGKLDVLLADMPDGTSQRIYARGPSSTGQYYGAGNVVAVLSKILGTSASLIGLSPDPRGTTNGLWRMLKDNGKWQPVEWINPPMELGTEYRTTERYLGKPVYCKLIDCGAVPDVNTNKTIGFSCPGISRIISWTGNVDIGGNTFALPYHEIGRKVNNASIYVFVNYTGITLRTDDQWFAETGGTAQCTIWYTKTAD